MKRLSREDIIFQIEEVNFEIEFNKSEAKNIDNASYLVKKSKRKIAKLNKKVKNLEESLKD